jgi:hypothetical protein
METIITILTSIFCGVSFGLFTSFLDDCMYPNMIFEKYGRWVASLGWIGKPLGSCSLCFNFWVTTVLYLSFFGLNIFGLIVTIAFSHYIINESVSNKIDKY